MRDFHQPRRASHATQHGIRHLLFPFLGVLASPCLSLTNCRQYRPGCQLTTWAIFDVNIAPKFRLKQKSTGIVDCLLTLKCDFFKINELSESLQFKFVQFIHLTLNLYWICSIKFELIGTTIPQDQSDIETSSNKSKP
jgi:hypothetical protein